MLLIAKFGGFVGMSPHAVGWNGELYYKSLE